MKTEIFDLYNFYCPGEIYQKEGNRKSLTLINISLPELGTARIEVERKYFRPLAKNSFTKTGTLSILLNKDVIEDHVSVANDVCSLISLALNAHIEQRSHLSNSMLFPPKGQLSHGGWREVILNRLGEDIRNFVESCWENYQKNKTKRRLFETIRLLVQINETKDFLEQKIALSSVMLENLKHTYASHNECYIQKGNHFYKRPKNNKKSLTIKQILSDMIKDVNMSGDFNLSNIINNRNKIIHQGLLDCSIDKMFEQYVDMVTFIREYLLSLLNFKGHYYSFNDPDTVKSMNVEPLYSKDI